MICSSASAILNNAVRVRGTEASINYKRATLGTGVPFHFDIQGHRLFSGVNTTGSKRTLNESYRWQTA
jgi:hypothetical protein